MRSGWSPSDDRQSFRSWTAAWRPLLLLGLWSAGCVRAGFESGPGMSSADGLPDATRDHVQDRGSLDSTTEVSAAGWLISRTKLTAPGTFSYVELDVDWSHKLAYASSREAGVCAVVVDFSDEKAPKLVKTLGPSTAPATKGGSCVGLRLYREGQRLLLTSISANVLELWNVGTDPTKLSFSQMAWVPVGSYPHRITVDPVTLSGTRVHVAMNGAKRFETYLINALETAITAQGTYQGSCSYNYLTSTGTLLMGGCFVDGSPINVVDASTMTLKSSLSMTPTQPGESGLWCGATTNNGAWQFHGGWVSAFVEVTTQGATIRQRFDNDGGYRDAVFVLDGGSTFLYAVNGNKYLDVWQVPSLSTAKLLRHIAVQTDRELYGIEVNTLTRRAIIVGNYGDFIVIDIDKLPPTTTTFPSF